MDTNTTTIDLTLERIVEAVDDAYRAAKRLPYGDPLRRDLAELQIAAHDRRRSSGTSVLERELPKAR